MTPELGDLFRANDRIWWLKLDRDNWLKLDSSLGKLVMYVFPADALKYADKKPNALTYVGNLNESLYAFLKELEKC